MFKYRILLAGCPLGSVVSFETVECGDCPLGSYVPPGIVACIECPDGKTTLSRGSVSIDDCVDIGK